MLGLTVDRNSADSLTGQLSRQLRSLILEGAVPAGTKLPSRRDLCRELRVARNVVGEAYDQLAAEGYLEGEVGSGTYVADIGRRPRPEAVQPLTSVVRRWSGIDFAAASGTPDLGLFPLALWKACVRQAWEKASYRDLDFGEPQGSRRLRDGIGALLLRHKGIRCAQRQIFVTTGITQAMTLALQFLRGDFDSLVLENPSVGSFRRVSRSLGYRQCFGAVDEEGLVVEALSDPARLFLVTPSHQFPSGGLLPIKRRLELLNRAERGFILEDDYDGETRFHGASVPPMVTLAPERVFFAGTFNKTMYPSLQIGYLVVPPRLVERFALFRMALSAWSNTVHQEALAEFLDRGAYDRHLRNLKRAWAERRAAVEDEMTDFGVVTGAPTGAYVRLTFPQCRQIDWRGALACGVRVSSLGEFLAPRDPLLNQVLLGYGNLDLDTVRTGLRQLKDFVTREASLTTTNSPQNSARSSVSP